MSALMDLREIRSQRFIIGFRERIHFGHGIFRDVKCGFHLIQAAGLLYLVK